MSQKRKNISLFMGVGLMGLVAWSALAAAETNQVQEDLLARHSRSPAGFGHEGQAPAPESKTKNASGKRDAVFRNRA